MSLVAYGSSDESDEDDTCTAGDSVTDKRPESFTTLGKNIDEVKINSRKNDSPKTYNLKNDCEEKDLNGITSESDKIAGIATNISDDEEEIETEKHKISDLHDSRTVENKSLLSLPAPKTKLHDIDFDWSRLTKGTKGAVQPIKISIPSLAELETEESSEPVRKKLKPSKKGSGLFALLPSPKNGFINQTKTNLKPQQIQKKIPAKPSVFKKEKNGGSVEDNSRLTSKLPSVNYDDSPDEDDGNNDEDKKVDFFSLSSSAEVPAANIQIPDIEPIGILSNKEETNQIQQNFVQSEWPNHQSLNKPVEGSSAIVDTVTSVTNEYGASPSASSASFIPLDQEDIQLDETALQQLCGRRERQKGASGFQIIDVNGDAILPDAREWMTKQLTEEQNTNIQSHKKKDGPTTQQRRKHQITYLAFQAKEHELELKNQWANNRMSRKQTQAKYGF